MLLNINTNNHIADKCRSRELQFFGIDELKLQAILFRSLDRLFPDDELILLMQSRRWQEEPDLMAVDKEGNLFIFELKAGKSHHSNLLQVLRYGQIFGQMKYSELDAWFNKTTGSTESLKEAHKRKFDVVLPKNDFNRKQTFVVITNGLDSRTREAIQYWRSSGLDVRPWVYRAYEGMENEMLLEMSPFRALDNPYEDLAEGYYILNTNTKNTQEDHDDMLANGKAAAYFYPWKFNIERLEKGDVVFLYQSAVGIVAFGEANGKLEKAPYQGNPADPDEEYSMKLLNFKKLSRPITAAKIKEITESNHVFMRTMFGLDADSGKKIKQFIQKNIELY